MARFSRMEVLNEILRIGMVPVFYHANLEVATRTVEACAAGGARVIEFTNRGDNAYRVFSDLVAHFAKANPAVILGVGSVLDAGTAALYIAGGANFVVGPVLNPDVARTCNRRKIAYCPGCGSASEISEAEELGAEIVKVFPGDSVGGPEFVKAVLGPMPWTRVMPTGGVDASRESIRGWFGAGVAAVGLGSRLITKDAIESGSYETISARAAQVMGWIREVRAGSPFLGVEHAGLYAAVGASGKALAEWYASTFGLKLREGNTSFFVEGAGPGRLEIGKERQGESAHIAIQVADLDAAVAALRARGVALDEPKVGADSTVVFLTSPDPAGHRVHLVWKKR